MDKMSIIFPGEMRSFMPEREEKYIFIWSVVNLCVLCYAISGNWFAGSLPWYYSVTFPIMIFRRYLMYKQLSLQWFLLDFCYFCNILLFILLWIYPNAPLFCMVFALANGPLLWTMFIFHHEFVFHSIDKSTSLMIHITPAIITYILRWHSTSFWDINHRWKDNICVTNTFENSNCANWRNMVLWPFLFAIAHQIAYCILVRRVFDHEWIINDTNAWTTKGAMWKLLNICGEEGRIYVFGVTSIVYATLCFLPTLMLYRCEWIHFGFIVVCVVWAINNGADFYGRVYANDGTKDTNKYAGIQYNEEKPLELVLDCAAGVSSNSEDILTVLLNDGFEQHCIDRALAVYAKYYGDEFDLNVIRELTYRLTIKDKIKELKRVQNLYQSRDVIQHILMSLHVPYVEIALTMYEVMTEMFDADEHHESIYDLELVTEMIMRLRAKDRVQLQPHTKQLASDDELEEENYTSETRTSKAASAVSTATTATATHSRNKKSLLDVIADRQHNHSRNITDSFIEITPNTNEMETDGEESPQEEEDTTPIPTMPPMVDDNDNDPGMTSADEHFDSIIAYNNAELRTHYNIDSKGNNIGINRETDEEETDDDDDDDDSFDIQQIFDAYCSEYGSPPREPKHLIYFAKERGYDISFTEAITAMINADANRIIANNQHMRVGDGNKSYESISSAPSANRPLMSNLYPSADSDSDYNVPRIQSKIHLSVGKTVHVIDTPMDDEDELEIEDVGADDEWFLPEITQIRPGDAKRNSMPVVVDDVPQNSWDDAEEEEIEYEDEYYEEDESDTIEIYDALALPRMHTI